MNHTQEAKRTAGVIRQAIKEWDSSESLETVIDRHTRVPALKDTIERLEKKAHDLELENKRLKKLIA